MLEEEAREYHASGKPGKIAIAITKPCATQHDLALAYTPGVAVPVREIQQDPLEASAASTSKTSARRSAVSVAGTVTKEMVLSMADAPIIFALANPDPEIRTSARSAGSLDRPRAASSSPTPACAANDATCSCARTRR
jgi:malic enzyme